MNTTRHFFGEMPDSPTVTYAPDPQQAHDLWVANRELLGAFGLTESQLPHWHALFYGKGTVWEILRLYFRVAPIGEALGTHALTRRTIQERLGINKKRWDELFANAARIWKQKAPTATPEPPAGAAPAPTKDDLEDADSQALSPPQIDRILTKYRFANVPPEQRESMAARILELKSFLDDHNTRMAAKNLLSMESSIESYQCIAAAIHKRIHSVHVDMAMKEDEKITTLVALQDKLKATETRLTSMAEKHQSLLEAIGADQLQLSEQRRACVDQISYFFERLQAYRADPENEKVDGVFTNRELIFLMTPTEYHEPLYRPDIVAVVREALLPENLWDPGYKPTPISREGCRLLQKLVKNLESAAETRVIPGIDDISSALNPDDEDAMLEGTELQPENTSPAIAMPEDPGGAAIDTPSLPAFIRQAGAADDESLFGA